MVRLKIIEAGHLLGTFEYQPSLVGTRSPNREGVIGPSLVIGKTSSRSNRRDSVSRETNAHPSVRWASCSARLLRLTETLSSLGDVSRKLSMATISQPGSMGLPGREEPQVASCSLFLGPKIGGVSQNRRSRDRDR